MNLFFITLVDKLSIDKTLNLQKTLLPNKLNIIDTYDFSLKNLSKIFKTYEYVTSKDDILDNDILCILDGHDVLFNNKYSKSDLIDAFKNKNKDLIISGQITHTRHDNNVKDFFEKRYKNSYKYLNSGVIIGYKWAYLKMFKDIIDNFQKYTLVGDMSDQRIIALYLKEKIESNMLSINVEIDDMGYFTTTISTTWEDDLDKINSYFIHVTFLKNERQMEKYNRIYIKLKNKND